MDICGPCKFRNEDTKATKYCMTCQEPQCKTCSDIHRSSKATRNHLCLAITELGNASKTKEDIEKFQNCCDHPEKKLEFFCIDHSHLLCSTCLLNIQKHDCKTIVDIEAAGNQIETNRFDVQLTHDLETIIEHYNEEETEIQRLIEKSHTERQELRKYIEDFRNKILANFNKCEKEILDEVDKKVKTQVAELKSEQTVLRETLQTAMDNKDILQMIISNHSKADIFRCTLSILQQLDKSQTNISSGATDMFNHSVELCPAFDTLLTSIDMHPVMQRKTVINTKSTTKNMILNTSMDSLRETLKHVAITADTGLSRDYSCSSADADMEDPEAKLHRKQATAGSNISNSYVKSARATASSLGTATESKKVSNIVHVTAQATASSLGTATESEKGSNIVHITDVKVTTHDEKQLDITGIITLLDGDIVLSDGRQPRLIRVKEDLTYKDTTELSHPPGNMTVLNEKYLVVCLPSANRVAFVSLSPELKWMRNFITNYTPKDVHALDATRLLLSMYDSAEGKWYLQILTTDGALRQDVGKARSILDASQISSLKLTPTSPRYYLQCCKASNMLYCFDTSGKDVFKHNIVSPKCLYVDSAGKIYVLGLNGSVHILTKDGKLLQTFGVPKETNGITCSKRKDILFVTKQWSDIIRVFKISH